MGYLWGYKLSPDDFQSVGGGLFFFCFSFNLLDTQSDDITARFVQPFTAKIQILHGFFVRSDF